MSLFKRRKQQEDAEPASEVLTENITTSGEELIQDTRPSGEDDSNINAADIQPIVGDPRDPSVNYETKFIFNKMFRDTEFPHRFEQIFSRTKMSFDPYRSRPHDTLCYKARELVIYVDPLSDKKENPIFEAIRQVLESDEIKQYGQFIPPDLDRPFDFLGGGCLYY